ncbi:multidrug resistance protein [Gottschalkia acidurici 9a]|uniref:Probable multidrug resistance protein NorM n=1 Tax=Gottschalkia acidurici (strain ATCC 7906 / DSM 604 / BCRC 14475 / CIP 104303 / KCTC 5404 / NCIMB 10678 / 9a) TaxID=1128398 RepID=K0B3Y2_GOTA9|nr:MATE family efflux transporter [Gottschalkia acidurici]AFS79832.1 multidrug resistance protein [Gottschalkia acidurici 9a]
MTRGFISNMIKDKEYYRTLFYIAVPVVIQNLIASSINMLDTLMVGRLGEAQIASVGISNQIFLLFNIMIVGLSSGCGVFISQYWGMKEERNIRKVLGVCLISNIIISLIFMTGILTFSNTIISIFNTDPEVIKYGSVYLKLVSLSYTFTAITFGIANASRSVERTIPPMVVSFLALICNGVINYILIFGKLGFPAMGVKGAAIGTIIARGFETIVLSIYMLKTNKVLLGKLSDLLSFNRDFVRRIYSVVTHVILNELCWGSGIIIYSIVYGRMGTQAIASVQIYNTIQNFFTVLILGLASASVVMIGKQIGLGDEEKAKRYGYQFVFISVVIGVILSIIIGLSAKSIVSLFDISDVVRYNTEMILYVVAVVFTLRCVNIMMIIGILRGGGDTKHSFHIEIMTMYGIGVPLSIIGAFVLNLPVYWVVALIAVEEIAKATLALRRLFSNKWIRNVSQEY